MVRQVLKHMFGATQGTTTHAPMRLLEWSWGHAL